MKTPPPCTPLIDPLGPDDVAVAQEFAQANINGRSTPAGSIPLTSPLVQVIAMFRARPGIAVAGAAASAVAAAIEATAPLRALAAEQRDHRPDAATPA
jgi:hypothetical protein